MRFALQMTLTAGMVRLYAPQESVTAAVPSRGTFKLPNRSPGQAFPTNQGLSGYLAMCLIQIGLRSASRPACLS